MGLQTRTSDADVRAFRVFPGAGLLPESASIEGPIWLSISWRFGSHKPCVAVSLSTQRSAKERLLERGNAPGFGATTDSNDCVGMVTALAEWSGSTCSRLSEAAIDEFASHDHSVLVRSFPRIIRQRERPSSAPRVLSDYGRARLLEEAIPSPLFLHYRRP